MRLATRLSLLITGAICVVVLIGATSYVSVSDLIKANRLASHSREVLQELNLLLYNLSDTVGTQRAYIITGQEIYLDAYHALVASTNESIEKVSRLVADDQQQSFCASKLNALIKERLASLEVTVKLYQEKGAEAAFSRVRAGKSLQFRIALHKSIDEMKQHEISLLEARQQEMQVSASSTQLTIAAGVCLGLAISVLFGYLFARYMLTCIRQLIRAADNIRYGRFDLSTSINSNDEFAELAIAFNTVGQQLLTVSKELSLQIKEAETKASLAEELSRQVNHWRDKTTTLERLAGDEQALLTRQEARALELVDVFADLNDIAIELARSERQIQELSYHIRRSQARIQENVDSISSATAVKKQLAEGLSNELSRQANLYHELYDNNLEVIIQRYIKLLNSKKQLPDEIIKNITTLRQSISRHQNLLETLNR
jgi:CHASE3 domain sensor protein